MICGMDGDPTFSRIIVFMVIGRRCMLLVEGHFREDRIEGVGTVTIPTNVRAKKEDIFMPIILPQGTIKEVHKAAGFEENGLSCVCYKHY